MIKKIKQRKEKLEISWFMFIFCFGQDPEDGWWMPGLYFWGGSFAWLILGLSIKYL